MGKIFDDLMEEFGEKDKPLCIQQEDFEKELEECRIASSNELRQLSAKRKLIDQEIFKLDAEGKFGSAEGKEKEKREVEGRIRSLTEGPNPKILELENQILGFRTQRSRIPEQIKNDRLYRIRPECHKRFEDLLDELDGIIQDFNAFCQETNAQHLTLNQRQLLGLGPSGPTRVLWERMRNWVTGW